MKLVIFTLYLCSPAGCPSSNTAALRRRMQRPGHRSGHYDQLRATHSERRRRQRPRHHDNIPATYKERHRGQSLGTTIKLLWQTTAAVNRLATTIKYLRDAAGIGLGTTTL